MVSRRRFAVHASAALLLPRLLFAKSSMLFGLSSLFAELETKSGGRLGVAVLDTATGERAGYRENERFPMCSTFKLLLTAATLHRADTGEDTLEREIHIPAKPLLAHSPLTETHSGGTMPLRALCMAAMTESDNTASNLLLEAMGGPAAYTRYARSLGDDVTRLDRNEPTLNTSIAGDPRDTTSPNAAVHTLRQLVVENALKQTSRDQLVQWMIECKTGLDRLRAGLPHAWRAGDKTGSNGEHTSNDVSVVWPTGRPPVFIAAYLTQCPGPEAKRGAVLAEVGRITASALV